MNVQTEAMTVRAVSHCNASASASSTIVPNRHRSFDTNDSNFISGDWPRLFPFDTALTVMASSEDIISKLH
jgi:hypothetical protein